MGRTMSVADSLKALSSRWLPKVVELQISSVDIAASAVWHELYQGPRARTLERLSHVVFGVALDDKEPGLEIEIRASD